MKKKSKLSRRLAKIVDEVVSKDLDVYDISDWKEACKSFAPITYVDSTDNGANQNIPSTSLVCRWPYREPKRLFQGHNV